MASGKVGSGVSEYFKLEISLVNFVRSGARNPRRGALADRRICNYTKISASCRGKKRGSLRPCAEMPSTFTVEEAGMRYLCFYSRYSLAGSNVDKA